MFTGIIEELGVIEKFDRSREPAMISIKAAKIPVGLKKGDSVSVNGVCLTVISASKNNFSVEAIGETLKKTNLLELKSGDKVNLEGALISSGKVSGHFVTGHIDGIGRIKSKRESRGEILFEVEADKDIIKGIVKKGSVAVDGISLTVAEVTDSSFSFYVIPHTANATILSSKGTGDKVNLETDILGKYATRHSSSEKSSEITEAYLKEKGFV